MSEEEKKAIEILKIWKVESISSKCIYDTISVEVYNKALKTLLNLIENQQKEIELKDKVIEEMAKDLYIYANLGSLGICDCELEDGTIHSGLCDRKYDESCIDCIKRKILNKVKENKE